MAVRRVFALLLFIAFVCSETIALSVMSVDIGNEFLKIAIVSPGKPMEIILNSDSARKTPLIVAFRDGERYFGEAALSTATRFPEKSYAFLLDLIGKTVESSSVKLYQQRFPYHNITGEPSSQLYVHHPEGMTFTPEELLAMVLEKAKLYAETAAGEGQKITEAVITVPPYFTQSERRGVLHAAQMAGLKVLQLINTYTAVALNYGVFRRKDFNESKPTHILFYDMGSTSTTACVASFQLVKSKDRGFVETNPQVVIKGVGFDRTLGGIEMQLRLRDHLAKLFAEQRNKKLETITSNKRAMNKLLKEAGRLKKVLSANTEHMAQVENVMDDVDLKAPVKREEFEALCDDLLKERVTRPVAEALKASGLTIDDIDQVIPFGGNTRVPKVQQVLQEFLNGRELSKSINADEAAALGAAYQAAYLSKGFKTKTFHVRDVNIYPIQVEFTRLADSEGDEKQGKLVQRTLFTRNNLYPQKKMLTFSKHTSDFDFNVRYGDLQNIVPQDELNSMNLVLQKVSVKGVTELMAKHNDKESKGIKAHFKMDESGVLHLDGVDALFEYKVEEQVPDAEKGNVVGDAFAKFGETISQLFGHSKDNANKAAADEQAENGTVANATSVNETSTEAPTVEQKAANETAANSTKTRTEVRVKSVKERLSMDVEIVDLRLPSSEEAAASKAKLEELNVKEFEKLARESTKNSLESFILDTKMKLYEKEYEEAVTDEEREKIQKELSTAGEWLEYESDNAETSAFREKLTALTGVTREMFDRVREHRDRPEALKTLNEMLNISTMFLNGARNASEENQIFTEVELKTLDTLLTTTQKWVDDSVEEQSKTPRNQTPKLLVRQIAEKIALLDREIKYLINKAKITPPKKKEPKPEEEKTRDKDESAGGDEPSEDENEDAAEDSDSMKTEDKASTEEPKPTNVNEEPHSEL